MNSELRRNIFKMPKMHLIKSGKSPIVATMFSSVVKDTKNHLYGIFSSTIKFLSCLVLKNAPFPSGLL